MSQEVRDFASDNMEPVKGCRFSLKWWDGSLHEYEVTSVLKDGVYYVEVQNGVKSKVRERCRTDQFKDWAKKV